MKIKRNKNKKKIKEQQMYFLLVTVDNKFSFFFLFNFRLLAVFLCHQQLNGIFRCYFCLLEYSNKNKLNNKKKR